MRIEHNFDLSSLNTFRMKVRCACYVEYDSVDELTALDWDSLPRPLKHIGAGSNLLFTGDFPGTVLKPGKVFREAIIFAFSVR